MASITINGKTIEVDDNITLIQACEIAGVEVPRFCYHERLAVAGNCRMCLVELEGGPPKPVASCATNVTDGMKVKTNSPMVKKAREGVMEFLLANHPLDCPICDQGGECDLQDQAYVYGRDHSDFSEHKRSVADKNLGPLIKTHMTRCIHCTRCVRFAEDVAGVAEMGAVNRGENMEITTYLEKSLSSELSGNVIDLCPVGALTSKPYAFKSRSWELRKTPSVDIMDGVGSNIRIDSRGLEVMRILPDLNEDINEEWISDKTRFCYDAFKYQRLDKFYIKKSSRVEPCSAKKAYKIIANKIKDLKPEQIAALSGNLSSVEDVFSLKLLLEKLGVDQIDCRKQGSILDSNDRASYLFNTQIKGIDQADSCLVIGANIRYDAPIINARIRKRYLTGHLKVATIGVDEDLTYNNIDLGDSSKALLDILSGESEYCDILKQSAKPMLIIGADILSGHNASDIINLCREIAQKYNMVQDSFNGFNVLHDNSSIVGALDVGFVNEKTDVNRATILDGALKGDIKLLYLLGDDLYDLKNLEDLDDVFIIYQGSHGDRGAKIADVIIPSPSYAEQDAIYVNTEGRPQETTRALFPFGDAKEGWENIVNIANELNLDITFNSLSQLRQLIFNKSPKLSDLGDIQDSEWLNFNGSVTDNKNIKIVASGDRRSFFKSNVIAKNSKILDSVYKELLDN